MQDSIRAERGIDFRELQLRIKATALTGAGLAERVLLSFESHLQLLREGRRFSCPPGLGCALLLLRMGSRPQEKGSCRSHPEKTAHVWRYWRRSSAPISCWLVATTLTTAIVPINLSKVQNHRPA
ncbi:hypothetical protein ISCGN_015827 [Ixodes scapularis]